MHDFVKAKVNVIRIKSTDSCAIFDSENCPELWFVQATHEELFAYEHSFKVLWDAKVVTRDAYSIRKLIFELVVTLVEYYILSLFDRNTQPSF